MKKWILGLLALIVVAGGITWASLDKNTRALVANLPTDLNVLFWTVPQRDAAFRVMEKLAPTRSAKPAAVPLTLAPGAPIKAGFDFDAYMKRQRNAGLLILHIPKEGGAPQVRLEKYALGFAPGERWTSFSVAKSFTSTLVGAAVKDGAIKSLEDKVSAYIPGLKGSAYDDVTIRQLLTMTSGVKWNEDYTDPKSDVALFNTFKPAKGEDATVGYMKNLPREAAPGSKWVYKTGETNLIGVLISSATKKPLTAYLEEKLWSRFMETSGDWVLGASGHEISGCCMSASLRDYARLGVVLVNEARGGETFLPKGWLAEATTKRADIGTPGKGYGFQWWTYDDGSYAAQGIFGQGIFIDAARGLVIASNGNWPTATDPKQGADREAMYRAMQAALDAEK